MSATAYTSIPPTAANVIPPVAGQAPAADTAAVLTLAADATAGWHIANIRWSYSNTPTNGSLTIAWGSVSETHHVTLGGPGSINFLPSVRFPVNTEVTITLAGGGGSVTGTVYATAWKE